MKRKIKKVLALCLMAIVFVSGCGKTEKLPVEEIPENIVEEVTEPEELVETQVLPFHVNVNNNIKYYEPEGYENVWMNLEYCDVTIEGKGYENLKRTVENWSMERGEELRTIYASLEERALIEAEANDEFYGYSVWQSVETQRADGIILSLLEKSYYDTEDEEGNFQRDGHNYDAVNGKSLILSDILSDQENFTAEAKKRVLKELQKKFGEELKEDYLELVENSWTEITESKWYLDASGIVLILPEYPEEDDYRHDVDIHLPYADFRPYLKEAYLLGTGDAVLSFAANQEVFVTVPELGKEMTVLLTAQPEGDDMKYSLRVGQTQGFVDTITTFASLQNAYLIKNGNRLYCLIEVDVASNDYLTTVYDLSDGRAKKIDEIWAAIDDGNINVHELQMEFSIDLLGTYRGIKTYQVTEEKGIWTEETEFLMDKNQSVLTTTVDLPVTLDRTQSTLPAGSHIILKATDHETYAKFVIQETGQTGVLAVERDPQAYYHLSVNGIDEWECFEMLPYAG